MIEVENLTKKFGGTTAVDNITFSVEKGEVFGLLGPNGAGKTTTIRMICCLISSTSGNVRVSGLDVSNKADAMKIRKMIGLLPDSVGLYESLSVYANLEYFGKLYESPTDRIRENIEKYLKKLNLWEKKDDVVGTFSKGMKQKVALARALIHDPEILIMDEPTANLDPEASKTIRDIILDLKGEGRTILLNTHNLDEAQRICTRIGVLNTRMLAVDSPQNLEKSLAGRKTVFLLDEVNENVIAAVKAANPESVEFADNRLVIGMRDPEKETPALIQAIVSAGGRIQSVSETGATLEDVYLKLVREEE